MSQPTQETKALLTSRLNTNYIPSDADKLFLNSIIADESVILFGLKHELARAKDVVKTLLQQHGILKQSIEGYRRIMYPMRMGIPDDVLREIFLCCIPSGIFAALRPNEAPLVLTAVCKTWRQVALDTPRLWCSLHIPIYDQALAGYYAVEPQAVPSLKHARQILSKRQDLFTRCISFSRNIPLKFSIPAVGPPINLRPSFDEELQFLHRVMLESQRIESLSIDLTCKRLLEVGLYSKEGFPILEELAITSKQMPYSSDIISLTLMSRWKNFAPFASPALKKLTVTGFPMSILSANIPWSQITHLTLRDAAAPLGMGHLVRLLQPCKQLVRCSIKSTRKLRSPEDDHQAHLPVSLPRLKVFDIDIYDAAVNSGSAFSSFEIPRLDDLGYFWRFSNQSPLISIVERCSLRKLNTIGSYFLENQLVECLRLCPRLEILVLSDKEHPARFERLEGALGAILQPTSIDKEDAFLHLFSVPDKNGAVLCPRLEVFQSTAVEDNKYTDQGILDFIRAKQEGQSGIATLKSVYISLQRCQTKPLSQELRIYRERGLDVGLKYWESCKSAANSMHGANERLYSGPAGAQYGKKFI